MTDRRIVLILPWLLLLLPLASGCQSTGDGADDDMAAAGLLDDWKLDRYCRVQDLQNNSRFVTEFGRTTLAEADVLLIGAVVHVARDRMNLTAADVTVLQILSGDLEVPDARRSGVADAGMVRVFSPQPDFFERMLAGEHVMALRRWRAGTFFEMVTTFPIDGERRDAQIGTILALIGIESDRDDEVARRERAKNAAMRGVLAEDPWVANVWGFQLAHLARDFVTLFSESDLTKLRRIELQLVQHRPAHIGAIRGATIAISNLIRVRFKRDWVRAIRHDSLERRRVAAQRLRDAIVPSYRSAFHIGDRAVLETLAHHEPDLEIRNLLRDASLTLQVVLRPPDDEP